LKFLKIAKELLFELEEGILTPKPEFEPDKNMNKTEICKELDSIEKKYRKKVLEYFDTKPCLACQNAGNASNPECRTCFKKCTDMMISGREPDDFNIGELTMFDDKGKWRCFETDTIFRMPQDPYRQPWPKGVREYAIDRQKVLRTILYSQIEEKVYNLADLTSRLGIIAAGGANPDLTVLTSMDYALIRQRYNALSAAGISLPALPEDTSKIKTAIISSLVTMLDSLTGDKKGIVHGIANAFEYTLVRLEKYLKTVFQEPNMPEPTIPELLLLEKTNNEPMKRQYNALRHRLMTEHIYLPELPQIPEVKTTIIFSLIEMLEDASSLDQKKYLANMIIEYFSE
jgi:hypothetical protein